MSEYSVELKGLNKVYSNLLKEDTIALKDINLQIRPGLKKEKAASTSGFKMKTPDVKTAFYLPKKQEGKKF